MKSVIIKIVAICFVVAITTSCAILVSQDSNSGESSSESLPPGHQKKVYGSKSAKNYAPGQKKKKHHKK